MSTTSNEAGDPAALMRLEHVAADLIGSGGIWEIRDRLARCMLVEALRRTNANYTRAAQLLGVTRQAVQQMVLRFDLERWAVMLRNSNTSSGPESETTSSVVR